MKFNKSLVAAALFVSTGVAQAGVYGTAGDMFLNVIDTNKNTAYSLDLGTTASALAANPSLTLSIDSSDANFSAFMTNTAAGDSFVFQLEGQAGLKALVATTSGAAYYPQSTPGVSAVGAAAGNITNEIGLFGAANVAGTPTGMSVYETSLTDPTFGSTNANTLPSSTTSATGTPIALLSIFSTGLKTYTSTQLTTANFSISGLGAAAVGSLAVAPVQAVPLPAAVWMFMTGLLGVFSSKRRKAA